MGAQKSRLEKAGGDANAAIQSLIDEYQAGARGWSPAQIAAFENPATRDAWLQKQIGQSTKGKFSGVLGGVAKVALKAAPLVGLAIPSLSPLAAAALAAGTKAGGDALSGQGFDPLGTLATGAGAYGAKKLMGAVGSASSGAGDFGKAAAGRVEAGSGGGGFFDTLGRYGKDALSQLGGGNPLLGAGSLALGALSAKESSDQRKAVEAAANYRNQLLSRGLGQAEEAYASRSPLRESGMAAIARHLANPRGLFQTPGEVAPVTPSVGPTPPPTPAPVGAPQRPSFTQILGGTRNALERRKF